MTGAPMPPGADAVVMIEDVLRMEGQGPGFGGAPAVAILEAAMPEQHVRRAGEDLRSGALVVPSGTRIRPAEAAMLATMGYATVSVGRPPRVAVFSTGDELVDVVPGVTPPPGKIRDSNRFTLAAMVREAGAEVHSIGRLPDNPEETERALEAASVSGADAIITAGGVSMGDRDFVRPAIEKLGSLALWKVAIKPGKPLAFGRIGGTLFFGLPGNPISAMVTFELFARPALLKMAGGTGSDLFRRTVEATMVTDVRHARGRREYVRASTEWRNGRFESAPSGHQGSSMLQSAVAANSLLVIPEDSEGLTSGDQAEVLLMS